MSQDFGKVMKWGGGGQGRHESVRIFIIARICNNEFISVISSCVSPGDLLYYTLPTRRNCAVSYWRKILQYVYTTD